MTQYEIMLLFDVQISEEDRNEKLDNIKTIIKSVNNSEILKTVDLGVKQLAYPIKKRSNGYYYLIYFLCDPAGISKIHNKVKYIEGILRYLVVKSEEDLVAAQEDEALRVKKQAEREARRAEAEAAAENETEQSESESEEEPVQETADDEESEEK